MTNNNNTAAINLELAVAQWTTQTNAINLELAAARWTTAELADAYAQHVETALESLNRFLIVE